MAKILLLLSQWIIDRVQNTLLALKMSVKLQFFPLVGAGNEKFDSFMIVS